MLKEITNYIYRLRLIDFWGVLFMSSWKQILEENKAIGSPFDVTRRKYLDLLYQKYKRNVIVYYSGWLQKGHILKDVGGLFSLNDADIQGFMATIKDLDRSRGLDLILHTPGGDIAATEALVKYLRSMFNNDIRAIIPQISMSAGTMIALSCKEIIMGKHSSLGPIDPQIGGVPAHGIIEEFTKASYDAKNNPFMVPLWQVIINKYTPTLIGESQKAISWTNKVVEEWLCTGMFEGDNTGPRKADKIIKELGDHALTMSHARHISIQYIQDNLPELNVKPLETDNLFQDLVLSIHHACIQTLAETPALKIIENQNGIAYIPSVSIQHIKS